MTALAVHLGQRAEADRPPLPVTDAGWCRALGQLMTVMALAPGWRGAAQAGALLANPPDAMLPGEWDELSGLAAAWLAEVFATGDAVPHFNGGCLRAIDAALAAMPVPVPAWAEREGMR